MFREQNRNTSKGVKKEMGYLPMIIFTAMISIAKPKILRSKSFETPTAIFAPKKPPIKKLSHMNNAIGKFTYPCL